MDRTLGGGTEVVNINEARAATRRLGVRPRLPSLTWAIAGIRTRLFLLILLPTTALVVLTIGYQLRDRATEQQQRNERMTASIASVAQTRHQSLDSTRAFMLQLSQNPVLIAAANEPETPAIRSACAQTLASIASSLGPSIGLGISDTAGDRICTSQATADATQRGATNIADRADFQRALFTRDFAIGEVVIGRSAPFHPSFPVSMPLYGDSREVIAILRLGIDISEATPLVLPGGVPDGTILSVVDQKGSVSSSSALEPGTQALLPDQVQDLALPAYLSAKKITVASDEGDRTTFITRISDETATPLYAILSVPKSALEISMFDALFPELLLVLGIAAVALAGAWWLGDILIARRTSALAEAARKLRSGEFAQNGALVEDDTEFGQVASAFNDISTQFNETIEKLQEAVNVKDEFLGLVSHELRTPVTTILGNSQVLMSRWQALDDETRAKALEDLNEDANRLRTIIENLLLVARLGTQQSLDVEPIIVRHTIAELVESRRQRHPDREYAVDLPDHLVVVEGNYHCIEQVMANLLNNAEKYSPAGSPITIAIRQVGNNLVVEVQDRGIGLDPAEAEELFSPFYRSRKVAKVSGIGLGLSVCQRLVEAQGGKIWARTREGGGSTFAFSLPITAITEDEEAEPDTSDQVALPV